MSDYQKFYFQGCMSTFDVEVIIYSVGVTAPVIHSTDLLQ